MYTCTHACTCAVSQHPPCPPPPPWDVSPRGCQKKMAAFQMAHSLWRDNMLISEVRRLRAAKILTRWRFQHLHPRCVFFFSLLDFYAYRQNVQAANTCSLWSLLLILVSGSFFSFAALPVLPYVPHRGDFTRSEILRCQHMSLAINLSHGAISLG